MQISAIFKTLSNSTYGHKGVAHALHLPVGLFACFCCGPCIAALRRPGVQHRRSQFTNGWARLLAVPACVTAAASTSAVPPHVIVDVLLPFQQTLLLLLGLLALEAASAARVFNSQHQHLKREVGRRKRGKDGRLVRTAARSLGPGGPGANLHAHLH